MERRDQSIDIAKGLGIITVVWGHMATACPVKDEIYIFHMALFFLLSGFFFSSNTPIKKLVYKKSRSLLFPYIFFLVFSEICFILLYYFTGRSDEIYLYPSLLIKPYGVAIPLWFLISLFELTILCKLLTGLSKNVNYCLVFSFLLSFLGSIFSRYSIHLPLYLDSTLSMTFFFYLGSTFRKKSFFDMSKMYQILVFFLGLIFFFIGVYSNITVDVMINKIDLNFIVYILSAVGAICFILILSQFLSSIKLLNNLLSYLGINSLVIFSLHMLCIEFARTIFGLPKSEEASYIQGIITVIVAIIFSLIFGLAINILIPFVLNPNIPISFKKKRTSKQN